MQPIKPRAENMGHPGAGRYIDERQGSFRVGRHYGLDSAFEHSHFSQQDNAKLLSTQRERRS